MSPLSSSSAIAPIEEIIAEMRAGRMFILVDEEDRENEGDLVLAAELVTAEAINFMVKNARGLVCLTITEARSKQLGLSQMARDNKSPYNTAFTTSIEAAEGVTTGISAQDRACTIADLINFRSRNEKLVERTVSKPVHSVHGEFTLHAYTDLTTDEVHLALAKGEIRADREALVRVHEPLTVLDFLDPTSGRHSFSLDQAQRALAQAESGVIVLLRRPESGQNLLAALQAPSPTQRSKAKWDPRIYGIGAQILRDLGVGKMKLLASPRRMPSMTGFDLEVTSYVASPEQLG